MAIDNFFSGHRNNIIELQKFPSFEFVRMDVKLKMNFKVDIIFNLACPASPVHYQKDPVKTISNTRVRILLLVFFIFAIFYY